MMHGKKVPRGLLLLLLLLGNWDQGQGQQRISQAKCQEYREANRMYCNPPADRIPVDRSIKPGDYPHLALLGWKSAEDSAGSNFTYQFYSSGSLISDRYVLAAAHGVVGKRAAQAVVRLGAVNLSDEGNIHRVDYEVAEVIRHPNYTVRRAYHDIALVRLLQVVSFSEYIRPACLWDSMDIDFNSLVGVGFGFAEGISESHRVQIFRLNILNKTSCRVAGQRKFPDGLADHQLCFAAEKDGVNCRESGAPTQITPDPKDCTVYIVGLGSHGTLCHRVDDPQDVDTRVASFIDWIEEIVWSNGIS